MRTIIKSRVSVRIFEDIAQKREKKKKSSRYTFSYLSAFIFFIFLFNFYFFCFIYLISNTHKHTQWMKDTHRERERACNEKSADWIYIKRERFPPHKNTHIHTLTHTHTLFTRKFFLGAFIQFSLCFTTNSS